MTMANRAASALLGPERRFVPLAVAGGIEIRQVADDAESIGFKGHAALFGVRTWVGPPKWGFFEEIRAGAFKKTIAEGDVRMLFNHDPNQPLARNSIDSGPGSLRLREDKLGLVDEADMIPTSYARDLALALEHKVVTGQSFSFLPVREEWSVTDDGDDVRTIIEVQLFDVGPVTFPQYEETDAALRALSAELDEIETPIEERKQIVRAFFGRVPTSDLALALRAALNAPAEREDNGRAPAAATRVQDDLLALESELRRRRMRRYAALAPEWTKGATGT
jgi:HK97 family phage prohead protease